MAFVPFGIPSQGGSHPLWYRDDMARFWEWGAAPDQRQLQMPRKGPSAGQNWAMEGQTVPLHPWAPYRADLYVQPWRTPWCSSRGGTAHGEPPWEQDSGWSCSPWRGAAVGQEGWGNCHPWWPMEQFLKDGPHSTAPCWSSSSVPSSAQWGQELSALRSAGGGSAGQAETD